MTEKLVNEVPTSYNPVADLERFNVLLDAITEKRFLSPTVFSQAVRGACDLIGVTFPLLEFEENGVPPEEGEWIFNIEDSDGNVTDTYIYIIIDRDEEGLYECYAQIVSDDELQDLLNMDEREFPGLVGDVSGETDYLKQTRHATFTGAHADDGAPLE
jgi:hypothetical protein